MTPKQDLYCRIFAVKMNAYQSAVDAGYSTMVASKKAHAWVGNSRATSENAEMFDLVKDLRKKREAKIIKSTAIDAAWVKAILKPIAEANIEDYVKFDGKKVSFKAFSELTKEQLSAIESIKQGRNGVELKLHGKSWSVDMINKHTGFYEEDNKQKEGRSKILIEMPDNARARPEDKK